MYYSSWLFFFFLVLADAPRKKSALVVKKLLTAYGPRWKLLHHHLFFIVRQMCSMKKWFSVKRHSRISIVWSGVKMREVRFPRLQLSEVYLYRKMSEGSVTVALLQPATPRSRSQAGAVVLALGGLGCQPAGRAARQACCRVDTPSSPPTT